MIYVLIFLLWLLTSLYLYSQGAKRPSVFAVEEERERCGGKLRSPHWPAARAAWLAKHPTCERCGSAEEPEVHHVLAFHERPDLELDESNLMTLCRHPSRMCHWQGGHYAKSWSVNNLTAKADAARFLLGRSRL